MSEFLISPEYFVELVKQCQKLKKDVQSLSKSGELFCGNY